MRSILKRFSVLTGFSVLLALLCLDTYIVKRQLATQIAAQVSLIRARQIIFALNQTESLLKDAETGQRGFLYTGAKQYLEDYTNALPKIRPELDRLEQRTSDEPDEYAQVPLLRRLIIRKLDELALTVRLYESGRQKDARAVVVQDAGLNTMNEIRQRIASMAQQEDAVRQARESTYQASLRSTIVSVYLTSFVAASALVLLAFYILREMRLRDKAASKVRAREQWFRVTLSGIGDAVIATDENGRVTFLNPTAEQLTGYSQADAIGKDIEVVFKIFNEYTRKSVENPIQKVLGSGKVVGLANHTVLESRQGVLTPIEDSAAPIWNDEDKLIGVVLVFRDASTARKSHEILRRTEKLAAAARLSATMAHEINNPLEAISNLIYIARGASGASPDVVSYLALAEEELQRISHITKQTLGFYRESSQPERVDLRVIIEAVLVLYSNKLKAKNITVIRDFEECAPVDALAGELKQAVANLIGNAADALHMDGTIRIKLECRDGENGKFQYFIVEDDGPGIAAEHIERIFEPFFTTKQDVGTGLGLWVTREIITRQGGSITAQSPTEQGQSGAVFTLVLPCSAD